MKLLLKNLGVLFGGVVIGTLLLTLAYLLPVNSEVRDTSYEILESEGWYPRATINNASYDTYFHSLYPDVLDGSSDRIMLQTALEDGDGNPLYRAMASHSEYMGDYSYYWHGYAVVLRVLFLFFDLSEIRVLNCVCQIILLTLTAALIRKERGMRFVFMFLTSYLLLMPMALTMSLQFSWVFYIAIIGTLIMVKWSNRMEMHSCYMLTFLAIGMCTSYFDLLTYPLFTWGMPVIWWIVVRRDEDQKPLKWIRDVFFSGISWIAGYAVMWVSKWIIGSIVLKRNVFEQAVNEAFFRVGSQAEDGYTFADRLDAIYINWKHFQYKIFFIILAGWLIWWIFQTMRRQWRYSCKCYAYALIGSAGPAWYFVLANHTSGHHFFTYRIFVVVLTAFLALLLESVDGEHEKVLSGLKSKIGIVCCILAVAAGSIPLVMLAREKLWVMNGTEAFKTVELQPDGKIELAFFPQFKRITAINLGLECTGKEGRYEVNVWDGEQLAAWADFCIADGEGSSFQTLQVDWKLTPGKQYRMVIQAKDNVEPIKLYVTENGDLPLQEYREMVLDGRKTEGQLLAGINYWCIPASKKQLLFLYASWIGVLMTLVNILWNSWRLYRGENSI